MKLQADRVAVSGAHAPLLPATSVSARTGEVTLVAGEPGYGQVGLALALGGRLVPSSGAVRLHGADDARLLRSGVALVDVPSVTEPEEGLTVRAVIAEELALSRQPARAADVSRFLQTQDGGRHGGLRWEQLPSWLRTQWLADLASRRAAVDFLVLASPPTGSEGTPATGGTSRRNWLAGVRASSPSAPTPPPGCCPNPCATSWG